jgi:hypothetical protein
MYMYMYIYMYMYMYMYMYIYIIFLSHLTFLVSVCAALLLPVTHRGALLGGSMRVERGGQRLAYDGIYDTPPVTWYYPASEGKKFSKALYAVTLNSRYTRVIIT